MIINMCIYLSCFDLKAGSLDLAVTANAHPPPRPRSGLLDTSDRSRDQTRSREYNGGGRGELYSGGGGGEQFSSNSSGFGSGMMRRTSSFLEPQPVPPPPPSLLRLRSHRENNWQEQPRRHQDDGRGSDARAYPQQLDRSSEREVQVGPAKSDRKSQV